MVVDQWQRTSVTRLRCRLHDNVFVWSCMMAGIGGGGHGHGHVSMPKMLRYPLEHGRADDTPRVLNWIRGAPTETEFATLQAQLDDHPSHKVIATYNSSLQCNWFLI